MRWLLRKSKRLSLVSKLSLLAIIPAILIGLLLAGLLNQNYGREFERVSAVAAEIAAENYAAAAAAAMMRGDRAALVQIAQPLASNADLVRVQFLSHDGEILAEEVGPAAANQSRYVEIVRPVASIGADSTSPGSVLVQFGLQRMEDFRHQQARTTILLLTACLALTAVAGWIVARRVSAPVLELAAAVDQLGRRGRGVRVAVTRGGEIGHLQRGFNAASVALTTAWDELEARIAAATDELTRKNASLEAAGRARARFLAAASHDLRQPLYALTLFSSALKSGVTDKAQLARASRIQECVATLDQLFSELLDISRLDTGAIQPKSIRFALDDLLDEVNRTFRPIAEERGLRLVLRKTDAWVLADRTMLARILNNLVSNALRYTQAGGILVGVRRAGDRHVRIEVWDTGSGIALEHQSRVFEEFFQVEATRRDSDRREYGMGLGLATVQRLAALLGIEVKLRSRPGRGSVFSMVIACVDPDAGQGRSLADEAPADIGGLRVLVIDDEPAILEGMCMLLNSWQCDIRAVEDCEQALDALSAWGRPDLVMSDLKLGGGRNGLDALREIDAHYGVGMDRPRPFARMLITGETKGEQLKEAASSRIPVLYKPVPPERLREAIIEAVAAIGRIR